MIYSTLYAAAWLLMLAALAWAIRETDRRLRTALDDGDGD